MNGEGRLSVTLVVSIIIVVAAIGIAAYFAGRFGRSSRTATAERMELPEPAAPVPAAVAEIVATPAEIPPTVTPPVPVVVERTRHSSKVLVERSSSIVVSVPPAPTARPASRILVEVRPTPTPTVPEIEVRLPPPVETPIPPPEEPLAEETPEPEPEPEPTARPSSCLLDFGLGQGGRPASM